MDVSAGLMNSGQGIQSWICVDTFGIDQVIKVDKYTMMHRCDLPARDLRLLDPVFAYPTTILSREKAIVVNLEYIRCVITADEVLLLHSDNRYVSQYVQDLKQRLTGANEELQFEGFDSNQRRRKNFGYVYRTTSPNYLPFEFMALEVALEVACGVFGSQVAELENGAKPLLNKPTSKISMLNLEKVRGLKNKLGDLTRKVQKVRDEIEQIMDDDEYMKKMYLTDKKTGMETSSFNGRDQSLMIVKYRSISDMQSRSAPASPVSSPPYDKKLGQSSSNTTTGSVRLVMLLEAYFVAIDRLLDKLKMLKADIDDTESYINIQLDTVRNQLILVELLLTTASLIASIFGVVVGIFGMNFPLSLFDHPGAFKWVLIIPGISGFILFLAFLWFFKYSRLMGL